ncbi:MAG: complex I subunit 5 family protein [Nitrososphaerales archaeon]
MVESWIVLQPIVILFVGAILTPLIEPLGRAIRFEKIRDAFAIIIFGLSLYSLLGIYEEVQRQGQLTYFLSHYEPQMGGVSFFVDQFSVFMALLFCLLGLFVSIYSVRYMEDDTGLDKYYSLLMVLVAGLVGISFAGDLFNLFIFWEAMSLSSYALVAFRKYRWEPIEASFKYLVMSTIGSLTALYAMSILYGLTGTLNISQLAAIIPTLKIPSQIPYLIIVAIIAGFGVTASIVPFHFWLPDAHPAAPSGISAMLSGVVIKAGVYVIARILFTIFNPVAFDFGTILVIFGIITLSVANFMALLQRDIKRLLAFSSIVNIGYIIFGFGIGAYALNVYGTAGYSIATLAVMGAIFHIFNHAIGKGLLFLGAGCFIHEAGTRDLVDLEGAGKKMPWTGTSFSLGLLTLAGVPPLSGFWSKLFIILAGFTVPGNTFMVVTTSLVVLNAIFAAAYYLWLMQRLMLRAPKPKVERAHEVPILMVLPVVILGLITVILGLWPFEIMGFAEVATKSLLGLIGG